MKFHKFSRILNPFILVALLFVVSCSEDDIDINQSGQIEQSFNPTDIRQPEVKVLDARDVLNNPKIQSILQKSELLFSQFESHGLKTYDTNTTGIQIDSTIVKHYVDGEYESYTFGLIDNQPTDNHVKNLVLSKQSEGVYSETIYSYLQDNTGEWGIDKIEAPIGVTSYQGTATDSFSGCFYVIGCLCVTDITEVVVNGEKLIQLKTERIVGCEDEDGNDDGANPGDDDGGDNDSGSSGSSGSGGPTDNGGDDGACGSCHTPPSDGNNPNFPGGLGPGSGSPGDGNNTGGSNGSGNNPPTGTDDGTDPVVQEPDCLQLSDGKCAGDVTAPVIFDLDELLTKEFIDDLPDDLEKFVEEPDQEDLRDEVHEFLKNENHSDEAKNKVRIYLPLLFNDRSLDWSNIENWFLKEQTETELEVIYDPNTVIYDPPLTNNGPLQPGLPSLSDFVNHFPKNGTAGNYSAMPTTDVYRLVGGSLWTSHQNNPRSYSNACSIRGSRALNYSGFEIPVLTYPNVGQRTQKGGDNKNYILDAKSFDRYMQDQFGPADVELTDAAANDPAQVAAALQGKNGIYVIINNSHQQAGYSGHVDAIIDGECISGAYTTPPGGVKSIRIWTLN